MTTVSSLSNVALSQLMKELRELDKKPCEGIKVQINEENLTDIQAEIEGPVGTPYEGGVFRVRLVLPHDFPQSAPKGHFLTKIFHPNVATAGEICVNVLKKDWKPDLGIRHVLLVIRCLLIEPFAESALNEEAGRLLLEDYEEYSRHAKLMTSIHAQGLNRPTPLTASGANCAVERQRSDSNSGELSPAVKKTKDNKGNVKKAAGDKKRSLKRL
uniref:E2 ubiquitin-conjugating enzyme n=3 Tax=Tetraselmis sp. GSL018 TaxID=582737 RepID=A0A061S806_9CHLO|eukprot:CAMPEP_0177600258 /NCGR_PEP_ID=MMETSP0419_2-20121207/13510_1 /TAXON_ID=582737 /ORGANISM="Tetraselmis sp., Strain GSL018" /LENGTH=213 /DNA_ID=CAMNT_0019093205 /DNA_START=114 /DNA_END=755 /DNA_ORIENTATION=-